MSAVILSTRAQDDLIGIKAYYVENRSPIAAAKVMESLSKGLAHVGEFPRAGRQRPELSGEGYKVSEPSGPSIT